MERYSSISRAALQELLLGGLGDCVEFGRIVEGFDDPDDGDLICRLSEDGNAHGLLVGADGTSSSVRKQLMPGSNRSDTGVSAIPRRVATSGDRAALTAEPIGGSAVVVGDAPPGMFIADHQAPEAKPEESYVSGLSSGASISLTSLKPRTLSSYSGVVASYVT